MSSASRSNFLIMAVERELLEEIGLTPQAIARYAVEAVARADARLEHQVSEAESER